MVHVISICLSVYPFWFGSTTLCTDGTKCMISLFCDAPSLILKTTYYFLLIENIHRESSISNYITRSWWTSGKDLWELYTLTEGSLTY